jgi:hypothetical protein
VKKKWPVTALVSLLCFIAGFFWMRHLDSRLDEVRAANTAHVASMMKQESKYERMRARLMALSNVEKYPDPQERIAKLQSLEALLVDAPYDFSSFFRPQLTLALAAAHYQAAEDYLYRAEGMAAVYVNVDTDEINPLVMENFSLAATNYGEAQKQIDKLKEIEGNADYNFHLQYTRGNIYYRLLQTLAGDEEKMEFFVQAALAWERALDFRTKDHDTQVNLEILQTNRFVLLSGATADDLEKLRRIPQLTKPRYSIGGQGGKF